MSFNSPSFGGEKSPVRKSPLFKTLLAGAFLLVSTGAKSQDTAVHAAAQGQKTEGKWNKIWDKTKDVAGSIEKGAENVLKLRDFTFDGSHRLFATDKKGNTYIDGWALISPVQVEIGATSPEKGHAFVRIPYRYSRAFNTAQAVSKEEQAEAARYIEEKLREEFAERLFFVDFPKNTTTQDVYRYAHTGEHPGVNKVQIKNITVTGHASPEGPAEKGEGTLAIGAIDKENLSLGHKRAEDMDPAIRTALDSLGINPDIISTLKEDEVQFTETELRELDTLAKKAGITDTADSLEAAYLLVKKYNEGDISDSVTKSKLNSIMGSKRMVEVELTYDEGEKKKLVVPIPLMLIAYGLLGRYLFRKLKNEGPIGTKKVRERFGRTLSDNESILEERREETKIDENHPMFIRFYNLAAQSTEAKEYGHQISERLIIDEINPYLGTKKDDIGYMQLVEAYPAGNDILEYVNILNRRQFSTDPIPAKETPEERRSRLERRAALYLLRSWESNDTSVRAMKGIGSYNELRYWQDPAKIIWAREMVTQLFRYGEIYREARNRDPHPEEAVYKAVAADVARIHGKQDAPPEREKIRTARVLKFKDRFPAFKRKQNYRNKIEDERS